MIKILSRLGTEDNFPNLINILIQKPRANIKAFLQVKGKDILPNQLFFTIVLEVLANAIRKEKEIKDIQLGKEEIKLHLFIEDNCLENPNEWTKKKNDGVNK